MGESCCPWSSEPIIGRSEIATIYLHVPCPLTSQTSAPPYRVTIASLRACLAYITLDFMTVLSTSLLTSLQRLASCHRRDLQVPLRPVSV